MPQRRRGTLVQRAGQRAKSATRRRFRIHKASPSKVFEGLQLMGRGFGRRNSRTVADEISQINLAMLRDKGETAEECV
jgi:hypothetical protein